MPAIATAADPGIARDENPEFDILLAAARSTVADLPGAEEVADIDDHLARVLVAVAGYHGIQPLLYAFASKGGLDLPVEVMAALRSRVNAKAAHSLHLFGELEKLVEAFEQAGVRVLVIKGAPLAIEAYGSMALRSFVDLDLVVAPEDFDRAGGVLESEGYRADPATALVRKAHLFVHRQYTFYAMAAVGASSALSAVDLHTAVLPPGYSFDPSFEALWGRSRTLSNGRRQIPTVSREDLVQVLCYHGLKSRWDRLSYVCDLARVVHTMPDVDYDALLRRASASHGRRFVLVGLDLCRRLFDAPLPDEVLDEIERDRYATTVSAGVIERLPRQAYMKVEPYLERVRFNLLAQDSLAGRARYVGYSALRHLSNLVLRVPKEA